MTRDGATTTAQDDYVLDLAQNRRGYALNRISGTHVLAESGRWPAVLSPVG